MSSSLFYKKYPKQPLKLLNVAINTTKLLNTFLAISYHYYRIVIEVAAHKTVTRL